MEVGQAASALPDWWVRVRQTDGRGAVGQVGSGPGVTVVVVAGWGAEQGVAEAVRE